MIKHVEVDVMKVIPSILVREVTDEQIICPECNGLGLVSDGHYIKSCFTCYGKCVLDLCKHCGDPIIRLHECEGKRNERIMQQVAKDNEKWEQAEKITLDEACKRYEMVVIDQDTYLPVDEVCEHIANMHFEDDEEFYIPHVWGTTTCSVSLDVDYVLESATEELHEEAYEQISKQDEEDLKKFLNDWCQRDSIKNATMTYYPDYRVAIVVTKNDVINGENS